MKKMQARVSHGNKHSKDTIDELNYTVTELKDRVEDMTCEKQKLLKRIQDLETSLTEHDLELPVDDIEGVSPRSANSALRILKTQYLRLRNEHNTVAKEMSHLQEENVLLRQEMHGKNGCYDNVKDSYISQATLNISESSGKTDELKKRDVEKELRRQKDEIDKLVTLSKQATEEKNKMQECIHILQTQNSDLERESKSFTQNLQGLVRDKAELQQLVNSLQLQLQIRYNKHLATSRKVISRVKVTI